VAVGQPLFALQARFHSVRCDLENLPDVGKPSGRQVIEISEPMFEVLTTRSIFDSEPHLLQRHSPMVVHAQHVDACFLQGAEQAPPTGRFVVARLVGALFETRFPLGTFIINISGSFLLGVLGTIVAQKVFPHSEAMRLALGVGFLGAFTTFSTFEFETHALFDDGSWLTATTIMFASLFVGLVAVRAGIVVAKTWLT
jgi:CrcB protein